VFLANKNGSPVPIRKVRVVVVMNSEPLGIAREDGAAPTKFHDYDSNHHVEIVRDVATGKWFGIMVTMFEAARRIRRDHWKSAVNTKHEAGKEFLFALHINDMLEITDELTGKRLIVRVQKMTPGKVTLRNNRHARIDGEFEGVGRYLPTENSLQKLRPQIASVSPLGEVKILTDIAYD
jgi:hypothetical protein